MSVLKVIFTTTQAYGCSELGRCTAWCPQAASCSCRSVGCDRSLQTLRRLRCGCAPAKQAVWEPQRAGGLTLPYLGRVCVCPPWLFVSELGGGGRAAPLPNRPSARPAPLEESATNRATELRTGDPFRVGSRNPQQALLTATNAMRGGGEGETLCKEKLWRSWEGTSPGIARLLRRPSRERQMRKLRRLGARWPERRGREWRCVCVCVRAHAHSEDRRGQRQCLVSLLRRSFAQQAKRD